MGTNHHGHAYLTNLLKAKMAAQTTPSRIVVVSSIGHKFCWRKMATDDLHYNTQKYSPMGAYAASKLANVLFVKSLADELVDSKVVAVSLHPGVIATNLGRHIVNKDSWLGRWLVPLFTDKTIPQGAATSVWGCLSPSLETARGAYLDNCAIGAESKLSKDQELRRIFTSVTETQIQMAIADQSHSHPGPGGGLSAST